MYTPLGNSWLGLEHGEFSQRRERLSSLAFRATCTERIDTATLIHGLESIDKAALRRGAAFSCFWSPCSMAAHCIFGMRTSLAGGHRILELRSLELRSSVQDAKCIGGMPTVVLETGESEGSWANYCQNTNVTESCKASAQDMYVQKGCKEYRNQKVSNDMTHGFGLEGNAKMEEDEKLLRKVSTQITE